MCSGLPATLFRAGILVKLNRVGLTETFQNPGQLDSTENHRETLSCRFPIEACTGSDEQI